VLVVGNNQVGINISSQQNVHIPTAATALKMLLHLIVYSIIIVVINS